MVLVSNLIVQCSKTTRNNRKYDTRALLFTTYVLNLHCYLRYFIKRRLEGESDINQIIFLNKIEHEELINLCFFYLRFLPAYLLTSLTFFALPKVD